MTARPEVYISVEEYLARERAAETRSEYYAGEMFAMAGGSRAHNLIAGNLFASLHQQLRRRPCTVYPSDMRVKVSESGLYTYPDVTAVCDPEQFEDARQDTLLNPALVVEVLSPSTESYDRGRKAQNYRTVASLQEYLLITQDAYHVEQFVRQPDGQWLFSEADGLDAVLPLPSIGCELRLADVYEKVELPGDAGAEAADS